MSALTPVSSAKCTPIPPQTASGSPEDDWEDWMEWDPSSNCPCNQPSVSPPSASGQGFLDQSAADLQTHVAIQHESFGSATRIQKRNPSQDPNSTPFIGPVEAAKSASVQSKSHSLVEKRYRTNLNDKIAELGQSVPSLRAGGNNQGNVSALTATTKHNKATVLTKAIEYIQLLEKRNPFLEDANNALRSHQCEETTSAFEQDALETRTSLPSTSPCASHASTTAAVGMIAVPDDIRLLRESVPPQPHYANSITSEADTESMSSGNISITGGKFVGKLMLGSLAGLMIMGGYSGNPEESGHDRGLFALPVFSSLPSLRVAWALQAHLITLPYGHFLIPLARAFLIFAVLGIVLFLYLFNSKPGRGKLRVTPMERNTISSACPMEMRRNAWLTAIQTVWVPQHTMLPELWALILETHAYLTRQVLGWRSYSWLTGRDEDDEIARIRAWDIAIDAQLVGGDIELSRSRLVLTLWASGTLPITPARLMLKALHIRITFWQASRSLWMTRILSQAGQRLACSQWRLAQEIINNPKISKSPSPSDPLPDHLVSLLQQPIEDVMTDHAIRHAHNLAWNQELIDGPEEGDFDMQTEDTAMLGSLDALAVWISNNILHKALVTFVQSSRTNAMCQSQLELAVRIAPPGSLSSMRAMAATAALCEGDREINVDGLIRDCPVPASTRTTASIPSDVCENIRVVVDCARALDILASSKENSSTLCLALQLLERVLSSPRSMELLTCAATIQLVAVISQHPELVGQSTHRFNQIVTDSVAKLDEPDSQRNGTSQRLQAQYKAALQRFLLHGPTGRRISITSVDTGYGSMSDDEHRSWSLATA